jgi:hypothetical protein
MHPDRMQWLKEESLFYVEVWMLVRLFEMPRSRRFQTQMYWDEYNDCHKKESWTDITPIIGCSWDAIGCRQCLSHRQATNVAGADMWHPQKTNPDSEEKCFWGEDGIDGGLCHDCARQKEYGCGWGGHECRRCVEDNHRSAATVDDANCDDCGPCQPCLAMRIHDEEGWWPHCRQACELHIIVCG